MRSMRLVRISLQRPQGENADKCLGDTVKDSNESRGQPPCTLETAARTSSTRLVIGQDKDVNATIFKYRHWTEWEEATLYVQEGIDYCKFASHPNAVHSKVAFNIVHNPFFYTMEFIVCCLLMGLAIIEEPAWVPIPIEDQALVVVIHSILEMLFLAIIAMNILLRFIWLKPKTFIHRETFFTAIIMMVMFVEAVIVLIRKDSHFRVTRCLRPVFFIDSYLMIGVRRILHQLLQCMKPIIDVMLLLVLVVAVFALAGYYLFADIDPTFFDTYLKSLISLFIALTNANHPDVFMEAYVRNRASPLFFILYLLVTLFFLSNVLLGVVYAHFSELDKNKFKRLFLHKRRALKEAYFQLAKDEQGINFHDFMYFMLEYKPRIPEYQVMCIFKALQGTSEPQEYICLKQFLNFYEVQNLNWKQINWDGKVYIWYEKVSSQLQTFFFYLNKVHRFKFFDSIMALVVVLNAIYLTVFAITTSFYCGKNGVHNVNDLPVKEDLFKYCERNRFLASHDTLTGSFIFTGIYMIEISIRILAIGPKEYFRRRWNRYDSAVILLSFILLCVEADAGPHDVLSYLVIFRPIKLLRLINLKKRYYKIVSTMSYLSDRLVSVVLLLVAVFYFYAIIGMEVFQGAVYVGCCQNALFETGSYYKSNATEFSPNVYWLNNFDNIYQSYVILFEEMVVNNWYIQMEGYASETNIFSRIYFFAFWITITICLSVAITYIVDAFVFSIHEPSYATNKCKKHRFFKCECNNFVHKKPYEVILSTEDIRNLKYEIKKLDKDNRRKKWFSFSYLIRCFRRIDFSQKPQVKFRGKIPRTKENVNLKLYQSELEGWIRSEDEECQSENEHSQQKETVKTTVVWNKLSNILLAFLEFID